MNAVQGWDAPAPVIIFVYNRPDHTAQTIETLSKNTLAVGTDLIIFSDAEKGDTDRQRVTDVRKFISTVPDRGYFRSVRIFEAEQHRGLAGSVIVGVTRVINEAGRVIVAHHNRRFYVCQVVAVSCRALRVR